MNLLRWLRGWEPRPVQYEIEGAGDFDFEVVGESYHQEELDRICGGKTETGHRREVAALLVEEPANRFDPNAVAVIIDGQIVAHLTSEDAIDFRHLLAHNKLSGKPVKVDALIVGGWDRGDRGTGDYGVKLDIDMPMVIIAVWGSSS